MIFHISGKINTFIRLIIRENWQRVLEKMQGDDIFTKSEAHLIISRNYLRGLLISDNSSIYWLDISKINSMSMASKYWDALGG